MFVYVRWEGGRERLGFLSKTLRKRQKFRIMYTELLRSHKLNLFERTPFGQHVHSAKTKIPSYDFAKQNHLKVILQHLKNLRLCYN